MSIKIEEFVFEEFDQEKNELGKRRAGAGNNTPGSFERDSNNSGVSGKRVSGLHGDTIEKELRSIVETTRQQALREAELIKEKAKRDGFERGYKDGYEKGLKDAKSIFDKVIDEYTSKVRQAISTLIDTSKKISEKYENLENIATDTVLEIAKKVILKELNNDKDTIRKMVKEALGLTESKKVRIKLNPEDAKYLDKGYFDGPNEVEVLGDESLSKGSIIIEEDNGNIIDASVDTKLQQIRNSMTNE